LLINRLRVQKTKVLQFAGQNTGEEGAEHRYKTSKGVSLSLWMSSDLHRQERQGWQRTAEGREMPGFHTRWGLVCVPNWQSRKTLKYMGY
jgi:hypothetical protein